MGPIHLCVAGYISFQRDLFSNILFLFSTHQKSFFHCSPFLLIQRTIFLLEKTKPRPPIGAASFPCCLRVPTFRDRSTMGNIQRKAGNGRPKIIRLTTNSFFLLKISSFKLKKSSFLFVFSWKSSIFAPSKERILHFFA